MTISSATVRARTASTSTDPNSTDPTTDPTTPPSQPTSPAEAQLQALQDQFDGKGVTKSAETLLKKLGWQRGKADTHFTKSTEKEVEGFQHAAGLHATGALDAKTIAAMRKSVSEKQHGVEGPGQKSKAVARNERRLKNAGYKTRTDGVFDNKTAKAASAFEHDFAPKVKRGLLSKNAQKSLQQQGARTKSLEKGLHALGGHPGHVDGKYTGGTQKALDHFRKKHHMGGVGHHATQGTLRAVRKAVAKKKRVAAAHTAKREMRNLLNVAARGAGGKRPLGHCLFAVQNYLDATKYGTGKVPRLPEAHDFADFLNRDGNAKKLGLKKLHIHNPYDAPPGAIVVVRAGTPGTADPHAGDIVVRGHGSHLYNDGEMSYGGSGNFPRGNNFVLGVYVPAGYRG